MAILIGALIFLITLVAWLRVHASIALLLTAVLTGLLADKHPGEVIQIMLNGGMSTLTGLALVIIFGMLLGSLLADTGATRVISTRLLQVFGPEQTTLALACIGFVLGLALFYNAGFMVLTPLVFSVAYQTGRPLVPLAIAMAAPLSVTHCFLPPHPGATAVATMLQADIGQTLLLGIVVSIPAIAIAAVFLPTFLAKIPANPPAGMFEEKPLPVGSLPALSTSLLVALSPVLLMAAATIGQLRLQKGSALQTWSSVAGDSNVAMPVGVFFALLFLVFFRGKSVENAVKKSVSSLWPVVSLLLILASGGAFKQVLVDTGMGQQMVAELATLPLSPLLLGWIMATVLRIAVGSATVAGITAAGIAQPLLQSGTVSPELMTLAIGAGSVMCSHVNDTGFWMFKEWFGLNLRDTFKSWTLMETIIGVVGIVMVLLLDIWV